VVDLRRGTIQPRHVVSLGGLDELRDIRIQDGELRLGALVTPSQLERSGLVHSHRAELLDAVGVFGTPQVRHRATIGGNLCTAASCGDLAPLLLALGGRVEVATPEGSKQVPLDEFFGYHRRTVLEPGHLLSEVAVPVRAAGEGAAYEAFGLRAANFITVAGVAAYLRMTEGRCTEARVALGAVAPTPVLVPRAAARLLEGAADEEDVRQVAAVAAVEAAPIADIRGSAEHRRELVEELCLRALRKARERAR
jgi:carbon-monoxide dehydrogenase medium subunit